MYVHKLFLCGLEENFKNSAYFFGEARNKLYIYNILYIYMYNNKLYMCIYDNEINYIHRK